MERPSLALCVALTVLTAPLASSAADPAIARERRQLEAGWFADL